MPSWMQEFREFTGAIISFPQDFFGVFGLPPSESGAVVTEMSALQISAYFGCVRVISDAVGSMDLNVYERLPDGGVRLAFEHPLFNLLHTKPNPDAEAADVRQAGQSHCLMTGNCYIEIDWSNGGQPLGLYLRSPFNTSPYRNTVTGGLFYRTHDNPNGAERSIPSEDMIHVKGLGIDSIIGLSPIKYYAREVLGNDIAAQSYSSKFFKNGAAPGGYLSAPGNLTPAQKLANMSTWLDAHGKGNNHMPAILEGGWKWEQTAINPEEAMLIQTRELNRGQIATIFGVPEHMVGGKEDSKANMEQKAQEFLTFCLKPWLKKWEQAINAKLFPTIGRTAGKYFAKFDTTELERANYADMIKGLQMARYSGLMTTQEGRKALKLNPYEKIQLESDDVADKLMIPVNMIWVTKDALEKPPAPAPGGGGGAPENPTGGEPANETKSIARPFTVNYPTFRDAFGRILARKKANEDDFKRTFLPVMVSIAAGFDFNTDGEPGDIVLSASKVRFLHDYISTMAVRAKDWTAEAADKQAADELTRAIRYIKDKIESSPREEEQLQES